MRIKPPNPIAKEFAHKRPPTQVIPDKRKKKEDERRKKESLRETD